MVDLFNITLDGNIIECDYIPEKSGKTGHVSVDVNSEEIKEVSYSDYEYGKKMYTAHVRSKLMQLWHSNEPIPKEATAVWY